MKRSDACHALGLPPDQPSLFTKTEVDGAYRKAARDAHPDRGGSSEAFQSVHAAKELLLHEIETGKKTRDDDNGEEASAATTPSSSPPVYHCWAGAAYDRPSTESPLSPLRQMGKPLDIGAIGPERMLKLWCTRQVQCVWRCQECDAVCCRIRRDKFKCVCGHPLKHHDPTKGFACACQAVKRGTGMDQPVAKGRCGCKRFTFLVSHGMWVTKCKCKHDHVAHDPATLKCRRCGVSEVGECCGWEPAWQCHCGHGCASHRTEFVEGFLGEGHRDWVVSGVRLECARLAEQFRSRPLHEQVRRRASVGLSASNLFTTADMWQQQREQQRRGKRVRRRRQQWKEQQQQEQETANRDDSAREQEEVKEESASSNQADAHSLKKEGGEEEEKEEVQHGASLPPDDGGRRISACRPTGDPDFFERHRRDVASRAARKRQHEEKIMRERSLRAPFQPRTNHRSSWKRRDDFYSETQEKNLPTTDSDGGSAPFPPPPPTSAREKEQVKEEAKAEEEDDDRGSGDRPLEQPSPPLTEPAGSSEPVGSSSSSSTACSSNSSSSNSSSSKGEPKKKEEAKKKEEPKKKPPAPTKKARPGKSEAKGGGPKAKGEATAAAGAPPSSSPPSYLDLLKRVVTKDTKKRPPRPPPLPAGSAPGATPADVEEPQHEEDPGDGEAELHLRALEHAGTAEAGSAPEEAAARGGGGGGGGDRAAELRLWLAEADLGADPADLEHLFVDLAGGETVEDLALLDGADLVELGVAPEVQANLRKALDLRNLTAAVLARVSDYPASPSRLGNGNTAQRRPMGTPLDSPVRRKTTPAVATRARGSCLNS